MSAPHPLLARSTAGVLNNVLLLAGAACSMCAGQLAPMLLGRALAGLGCGAASVLVPRYLAETAPLAIRGALGTLAQVRRVASSRPCLLNTPCASGLLHLLLTARPAPHAQLHEPLVSHPVCARCLLMWAYWPLISSASLTRLAQLPCSCLGTRWPGGEHGCTGSWCRLLLSPSAFAGLPGLLHDFLS